MRSLFENKRLVLAFAVLALGALTILAISLNQVPFREGAHFVREESAQLELSSEDVSQIWGEVPLWKQLFLWVLLSLLVVLIGLILSPEMRKRFFIMMIRMAVTFWGIYFLLRNYGDQLFGLNPLASQTGEAGTETGPPPPVFQPPEISPVFSYLISFAFALLWLGVLWGLYRGWKRYQNLNSKKSLEEIARIARSSLDDLSSGRNSSDVIINCYLRMSDVVSHKKQLQREIAMTPQEFAVRLERAGLPGDAVSRLTRLFETVRYGDRKSAPREVTEAVNCLKTILHYCGEPV
jgi:uncharacterized protein DUF4129